MQGEQNVVQGLSLCLKDQLTAINQFFLHARIAKDWGLGELDAYEYRRSIKSMKMADRMIERILFLEGLPNLQNPGKLMIGQNVPEMLKGDLMMLSVIRTNLQATIKDCEEARDFVSRDELQEMLEETEEHIDWVETQHYLIDNVGLENYLQSQMGG